MSAKQAKTNAVRILENAKIPFETETYEVDESDLSGEHIANTLGQEVGRVFKTLVMHGDKTGFLVCCVPVAMTVNLKSVAVISGNKSVEMIHVKELLPLTGYVRGGCSPVGMKKKFPTFFHSSALDWDRIYLSGGRRGLQIIVAPADIVKLCGAQVGEIAY